MTVEKAVIRAGYPGNKEDDEATEAQVAQPDGTSLAVWRK
jgi:hypothetical protein